MKLNLYFILTDNEPKKLGPWNPYTQEELK